MPKASPTYTTATQSALHLLRQWQIFMDGIDCIFAFWGLPTETQSIQGIEWQSKRQDQEEVLTVDNGLIHALQRTKSKGQFVQWLQPGHLPFETEEDLQIGQLDLFSETNYLVLHLKVPLDDQGNTAWYYLFFRDDKSNFGISSQKATLSTSEKAIIGRLANNYASACLNSFNDMKIRTGRLKESTQQLLETKHNETISAEDDLKNWKILWLDQFITELSQRDGLHYVIPEISQNTLLHKCRSQEEIEYSIKNSIVYICELFDFEYGDEVELHPSYLQITTSIVVEKKNTQTSQLTRIGKTMRLLDRLEESARKVLAEGYKLTSAEVGKQMEKAITAPAISDALRKNKVRILQLFAEYPTRWTTIRAQFKPVVNLNSENNQRINHTS